MHIELDDWFDIEAQHMFFDALAMGHTLVNQLSPTHPPQVGATHCTSTKPDNKSSRQDDSCRGKTPVSTTHPEIL